jgi:hypothetical protein
MKLKTNNITSIGCALESLAALIIFFVVWLNTAYPAGTTPPPPPQLTAAQHAARRREISADRLAAQRVKAVQTSYDAHAMDVFAINIDTLDAKAGSSRFIHSYRITGCVALLTVDADVWNGISDQDQQLWYDEATGDFSDATDDPYCHTMGVGWTVVLWDLESNELGHS